MNLIMGDAKKFDKYGRYGAYHWRWYGRKENYTRNADFLRDWVAEKNVIDIGAGDGFITHHLGIRGIDNDATAVQLAQDRGVPVDLGDAYALPYQDEQFDSALMSDVIEHFTDYIKPLSEARRVIRKHLYVNISEKERYLDPDHYHTWTPEQFITAVRKVGFALSEGPITGDKKLFFKFRKLTELCLLAEKYGTDKCPQIKHFYTPVYYDLLKDKRGSIKKVVEMGVGYCRGGKAIGEQAWDRKIRRRYYRGAGLFMWRDFFPHAQVYGADLLPQAMFEDDRIKTFLCDETKETDLNRLVELVGSDIDLFVDDASHLPEHQIFLAKTVLPQLKKEVVYIIEDVAMPSIVIDGLAGYGWYCPEMPGAEKLLVVSKC